MKILVTGSQGTLGKVLLTELRSRGHNVWGCDLHHSADPQEIRADVSVHRQLQQVMNRVRPEAVYHLAAEFGRNNGQEYPEQLWITNQVGTRNVIEECLEKDARLILAGSSEAYGDGLNISEHGLLFEDALNTRVGVFHNEYALSKWTQERQVFIAAKNYGLKAVVLRFFNAYGPGERYTPYRSVVCLFCYRLLMGLPVTVYRNYHRVFMYIDDWTRTVANVAERFDALLNQKSAMTLSPTDPRVPVYNIGGTEYRSVEALYEIVQRAVGRNFKNNVTFLDKERANVTNKCPSIEAAVQDLSHSPRVTLEEGVPKTVEWLLREYKTPSLSITA